MEEIIAVDGTQIILLHEGVLWVEMFTDYFRIFHYFNNNNKKIETNIYHW